MNAEVPEEYGGLGLGCLDHCLLQEEIAFGCTGFNTSLAGNMLGAMPIIIAGTDEQKKKYLTRLIEEPIFAAYCCSEPGAGSDVAGMSTHVEKKGSDYVINGQKRWITNGGVASFYTVLATFDKSKKHKGIACFVVDRDTPGVSVGRKEDKLGQRCSNTTDVIFEDVVVPEANLLGQADQGFKIAMKTFDRSRPWIAAGAAGLIRQGSRREPPLRPRAQDLRRPDRPAPGHPVHDRRDGHRPRGDPPAVPQGRLVGRSRRARQHRLGLRQGLRRRQRHEGRHRCGPGVWRLRLHQASTRSRS